MFLFRRFILHHFYSSSRNLPIYSLLAQFSSFLHICSSAPAEIGWNSISCYKTFVLPKKLAFTILYSILNPKTWIVLISKLHFKSRCNFSSFMKRWDFHNNELLITFNERKEHLTLPFLRYMKRIYETIIDFLIKKILDYIVVPFFPCFYRVFKNFKYTCKFSEICLLKCMKLHMKFHCSLSWGIIKLGCWTRGYEHWW